MCSVKNPDVFNFFDLRNLFLKVHHCNNLMRKVTVVLLVQALLYYKGVQKVTAFQSVFWDFWDSWSVMAPFPVHFLFISCSLLSCCQAAACVSEVKATCIISFWALLLTRISRCKDV